MNNQNNLQIYKRWSPWYDRIFDPLFRQARQKAIHHLSLQGGEQLLIVGIGTGLDLLYLPSNIQITGTDLSPEMLAQAKIKSPNASLLEMDAQALTFEDQKFDAVLLSLILSVVPDPKIALAEAWRVLKPKGCIVIFDKFLPESAQLNFLRRGMGWLIRQFGTDPNRRFSEILGRIPSQAIQVDEPSLLGGQYRLIRLQKSAP